MDVFDLVAKIRLDDSEYEQGVGKAKGTFSTLASGVGKGLATVAKVGAAAVTAGVAGVAALTKMGVEGYAQYEQLAGGVQTLFGAGGKSVEEYAASVGKSVAEVQSEYDTLIHAQNNVMQNASNAYFSAGMSANQYMETVTSFSASLIQSLEGDTVKAAEVADRAIIDMSDNANKMGTDIGMIQNAYQGFAKQNYTMLDNLKLGYGGTQEEMKRLIADAAKMTDVQEKLGITVDASSMSFDNVVNAISVMQESLGIAGATANEAATTIEGSIGMMKAAWENLVVGMADSEADMEVLISNFVESTAIAAKNLLPRIEQTLRGIGDLITALAPVIADALPVLVESVLPSLLTAGVSLISAIVKGCVTALPALYKALLEGVKIILVEVFGVSEEKAGEFADSVNSFFVKIKDGFLALVKSAQTEGTWLNEIWTGLKNSAKLLGDFLSAVWSHLSSAFGWCVDSFKTEGSTLSLIWDSIKTSISAAVKLIQGVISTFTSILKGDWSGAWNTIKKTTSDVFDGIVKIVNNGAKILAKAFDFKWELPKLKLPHISVTGGVAPYGIGGKGSLPKFSIEWYKKAYDNAMILSSPTIFGYSAASGKFLGGGDGNGNEIVSGESYLMNLIGNVVAERNGQIVELLSALLEATVGGNAEMVHALMADRTFAVGEREFARLVKTYA